MNNKNKYVIETVSSLGILSFLSSGGEIECRQTNLNTTVIEKDEMSEMSLPQQDQPYTDDI